MDRPSLLWRRVLSRGRKEKLYAARRVSSFALSSKRVERPFPGRLGNSCVDGRPALKERATDAMPRQGRCHIGIEILIGQCNAAQPRRPQDKYAKNHSHPPIETALTPT